jgi:hypothetical protein
LLHSELLAALLAGDRDAGAVVQVVCGRPCQNIDVAVVAAQAVIETRGPGDAVVDGQILDLSGEDLCRLRSRLSRRVVS